MVMGERRVPRRPVPHYLILTAACEPHREGQRGARASLPPALGAELEDRRREFHEELAAEREAHRIQVRPSVLTYRGCLGTRGMFHGENFTIYKI